MQLLCVCVRLASVSADAWPVLTSRAVLVERRYDDPGLCGWVVGVECDWRRVSRLRLPLPAHGAPADTGALLARQPSPPLPSPPPNLPRHSSVAQGWARRRVHAHTAFRLPAPARCVQVMAYSAYLPCPALLCHAPSCGSCYDAHALLRSQGCEFDTDGCLLGLSARGVHCNATIAVNR